MTFLIRFGAISGVLSALCIAVPGAIEVGTGETLATSLVLGASPALALPLLISLHIGQMRRAGRLGNVGFAVNLIGLGLFGGAAYALNVALFPLLPTIGDEFAVSTRLALLVSAAVFVAGVVIFGAAMLRARVYPRVPVWLYLLAFPPFALAARLPDSALTSLLHVVVGLALGWLAVAVWSVASRVEVDATSDGQGGSWVPAGTA